MMDVNTNGRFCSEACPKAPEAAERAQGFQFQKARIFFKKNLSCTFPQVLFWVGEPARIIWEMVGRVTPYNPYYHVQLRNWLGLEWKKFRKVEACNFLEWKRNGNALHIHIFFLGCQKKSFRLFISLFADHFRCPGLLPHRQWSGYCTSVAHGRRGQNRTLLTSSLLVTVRWMNFWEAQNGKEDYWSSISGKRLKI